MSKETVYAKNKNVLTEAMLTINFLVTRFYNYTQLIVACQYLCQYMLKNDRLHEILTKEKPHINCAANKTTFRFCLQERVTA